MGIYYSASIVVGLPKEDILKRELFDYDNENYDYNTPLISFPPYYDGGGDDFMIVGISAFDSGEYTPSEFVYDQEKIEELKLKFKTLTGQDAKVWLTPVVG